MAKLPDYKNLLLQFIGSLCLCDHMGDVSNDILTVLEKMELNDLAEWDDFDSLAKALNEKGITTLFGTSLT